MAAILTPSTAPTTTRSGRTRRSARPAMPMLPFPEATAESGASIVADSGASVRTESFFDSVAASIEGATARALHPASTSSVSATDPTVEFDRPSLRGLAGHAQLADGLAPWNRSVDRTRTVRHLHVVREESPAPIEAVTPRAARSSLRTVIGGVVLAFVIALAAVGALQFFGAAAAASTPAATTDPFATTGAEVAAAAAPVAADAPARRVVVVQRGDSIWTVARRIQPTGDLRHLVDALIARNGGATVDAGQRLDVTGLVD